MAWKSTNKQIEHSIICTTKLSDRDKSNVQSNVKTRDARRINQVLSTCTNKFPTDENIVLSSKQEMDHINIPTQINKDESSNKNKYIILNQNKARQLDQHLAIINQHSHRSLDTQIRFNLLYKRIKKIMKRMHQMNQIILQKKPSL